MGADLDFGKLAFKFQGDFDFSMQYEKLDCVYYDFSTYLAISTPSVGEEPSSSSDWVLMCQGYGLASEQEVAKGVVDNKAISPKELKNNKATKDEIISGIEDKIVTPETLRFLGGFTHVLFEEYTAGAGTWVAPDYYGDGKSYRAEVVIIGGGAGAGCELQGGSHGIGGEPGANGGLSLLSVDIIPNNSYNYVVASGGKSRVYTNARLPLVVANTNGGSSSMFGETVTGGTVHVRITGARGIGNYDYSAPQITSQSNVMHQYNALLQGTGGDGNLTMAGKTPHPIPFSKKNAGLGAIGMTIGTSSSTTPSFPNSAFAVNNGDANSGMIAIYVRPRS